MLLMHRAHTESTRGMRSRRAATSPKSRRPRTSVHAEETLTDLSARWEWRQDDSGRLVQRLVPSAVRASDAPRASLPARWMKEVQSVFLPAGYPASVRPEYLKFQAFDTLQAACSYLRSILTTSAILRGAGVGEEAASPMAAAVAWVLRDGVGMFGSLVFSYIVGASFDVHVKEWRLFADLINDVGLTLDMLAPLAGSYFVLVAALGAACKTICGMVAGATRASITSHFSLRDNLADVSAKESAQETAVTLVGLLGGTLLARRLDDSAFTTWIAFGVLTALHVWANWLGVGCLTFDVINPQRAALLTKRWWQMADGASNLGDLSPRCIAKQERIWGPLQLWRRGPRLGVGIRALIDPRSADGAAAQLRALEELFAEVDYLLRLDEAGVAHVALKAGADGATVLRALLHAELLAGGSFSSVAGRSRRGTPLRATRPAAPPADDGLGVEERRALEASLGVCNESWPAFRKQLVAAGWQEATLRFEQCWGRVRVRVSTA